MDLQQETARRSPTPRMPLLALLCAGVLVEVALALAAMPGVDGVRLAIRLTARSSLALFLLAFTASAAARRWPGAGTSWLLRHRRQIGLGFAFSHATHLAAIVAFARLAPAAYHAATMPAQYVTGGIAYVFIAAMAATSSDRAVAWLGARRWRRLHLAGQWYLWASFAIAFGKRVPGMGGYAVPVALLLVALALRLATPRARRAPAAALP
jgi:DMSO/TMAO reductase YedYZ heme-binding membrane subunit